VLQVEGLSVYYGNVQALREISLSVEAGEVVTLIGANGAGKTTTLKGISGLVKIAGGGIHFLGQKINGLNPENIVARGVAHCPEGRRVFPLMTLIENLEMGAYCRKDRAGVLRNMEEVMAFFPILQERQKQLAGTLSGGEQQMLAIARSLMANPKLLMLDEPSLGLAPLLVEEIYQITRQINSRGTTILLVEQNARMALSLAHKGYVLETGSIVLEGQASELVENAQVKEAYLGG